MKNYYVKYYDRRYIITKEYNCDRKHLSELSKLVKQKLIIPEICVGNLSEEYKLIS